MLQRFSQSDRTKISTPPPSRPTKIRLLGLGYGLAWGFSLILAIVPTIPKLRDVEAQKWLTTLVALPP